MTVLVVDAQGGGIGRQLVAEIRKALPEAEIIAVGTNAAAAAAMRKAGADHTATGENSVVVTAGMADFIIGPVGIVIADSMYGEITPAMALAVSRSKAKRILIPFNSCFNYIAGADLPTGKLIEDAVSYLRKAVQDQAAEESVSRKKG